MTLKRYRKGTWQNSMSFHDKNSKTTNGRKVPQNYKGNYENCMADVILNGEKKESFLSNIRSKIRMPTFISDIQRCTRSANQSK